MKRDGASMHDFSARHVAGFAALLLAGLGLTGCGHSRDDFVPSPGVRPSWVSERRKNAEKVTGGDAVGEKQNWDGWGRLTGRIVVTGGTPATPDKLAAANQDKYCGEFRASGELRTEDLVLGPGNGLKNVALFVTTKGAPSHESYAASAKEVIELDNHHCRFEPHVCLLRTSQSLKVKNTDTVGHNTKYNSSVGEPFNENIPAGGSITKQFTREERKPTNYNCDVHKWMSGYLVLRSNPYMAKTADDGSFEIKNLPAGGTLEIEVWHERAATVSGEIKEAKGATKLTLDKRGRLTVVLPRDADASFVLEVPAEVLSGS